MKVSYSAPIMAEKLNFQASSGEKKNLYVAWCPDLDTASQGKTIEESLTNPKEAIQLHLEDEEATTPKKKYHPPHPKHYLETRLSIK